MKKNSSPTSELYALFELIFDYYNEELYNNELPRCMFIISRKSKSFGYYIPKKWVNNKDITVDEIAINPMTFGKYPMLEILQTIVHEMCHMWQEHFGTPSRTGYHNKEWSDKMKAIGLMPSDTGQPGGKTTGQQMADYSIVSGKFDVVTKKLLYTDIFSKLWFDVTMDYIEGLNEVVDVIASSDKLSIKKYTNPLKEDLNSNSTEKKEIKDKSKVKYACPVCSFNVWGKIGLNIICGECKTSYQ